LVTYVDTTYIHIIKSGKKYFCSNISVEKYFPLGKSLERLLWASHVSAQPLGLLLTCPHRSGKKKKSFFLPPCTLGRIRVSSVDNETIRLDFSDSRYQTHDLLASFSQWFFSFSFIFILVDSLKNYSKSQKNHKMENPIFLDST
jgi:hypothetical protein